MPGDAEGFDSVVLLGATSRFVFLFDEQTGYIAVPSSGAVLQRREPPDAL